MSCEFCGNDLGSDSGETFAGRIACLKCKTDLVENKAKIEYDLAKQESAEKPR